MCESTNLSRSLPHKAHAGPHLPRVALEPETWMSLGFKYYPPGSFVFCRLYVMISVPNIILCVDNITTQDYQ